MAPDDAQPAPTEQEPVDYKKQYESALRAGVKFPVVTPKIPRVILCKDYTVRPSHSG